MADGFWRFVDQGADRVIRLSLWLARSRGRVGGFLLVLWPLVNALPHYQAWVLTPWGAYANALLLAAAAYIRAAGAHRSDEKQRDDQGLPAKPSLEP